MAYWLTGPSWLTAPLGPVASGAYWVCGGLCLLTPLGLYWGRLTRMAIGLLGRLAHCPSGPPWSSLSGRPAYWGSGHWPPWGLTGFLGHWLTGFLGRPAYWAPGALGSLVGLLHLALLAPGLTGTWPHWHLASLAPGLTGTWRGLRLVGWGGQVPPRTRVRMHTHVCSTVKSS